MSLTREQILASQLKTRDVEAFGGIVTVRELTASEALALRERAKTDSLNELSAAAAWIIATVVDRETKQPLFTEADTSAILQLGNADINRLCQEALLVNGIGDRNQIEALAKNSLANRNGDSASDWRNGSE